MRSLDDPVMKRALHAFIDGEDPHLRYLLKLGLRTAVIKHQGFQTLTFFLTPDEAKLILATLNLIGIE